VINTRPAPQVLRGQPLAERLARIRRQMRERGYTRPYQDVAAEIRARYALYRGLAEAPPPHQAAGNGATRARPSGSGAGDKARPSPPPGTFSSGRGD
jgi:hypothetical protein